MDAERQHDLMAKLKELASELGRTPKRDEYKSRYGWPRVAEAFYPSWAIFVQAAGLDPVVRASAKKIDNSVFRRDLEAHLERYKPKAKQEIGPYPTAAILSDIHWPFESQRVVAKFLAYVEKHKPEWVIINGDAWDFYSHSKYPRSHNEFTPREEERLARERNEKFWKDVQAASPGSKCVQMMGNHCIRPLKRVLEVYPAAEDWIEQYLKNLFTFDGVKTVFDPREELFLREDIIVLHGYRSKLGQHRDFTLMSCFTGHTHRGGVVWRSLADGRQIFECNSGVAGDPESKGLTYTAQKIHDWTPGFAIMCELGPMFVPA